jgi:hypothetical protein
MSQDLFRIKMNQQLVFFSSESERKVTVADGEHDSLSHKISKKSLQEKRKNVS